MATKLTISIDFKDRALENAHVSILDHGFLFGDSVYEVVRTWKGQLLFADEHLDRLRNSADGIGLPLPCEAGVFKAELARVHSHSGNAESYVRLIVTRGTGELELAIASCHDQRVIVIAKTLTVWDERLYREGGKLSLVSVRRNSPRATNPAFKTGNYLNNVLAIEEARKAGAVEALMLNAAGELTECTTANVFIVKGGRVRTPALSAGILSGVTRAKVLSLGAGLGVAMDECVLKPEDALAADEAFITSTTRDVMPITRIDEHVIGAGAPGPVTKRIMAAYRDLCGRSASNV